MYQQKLDWNKLVFEKLCCSLKCTRHACRGSDCSEFADDPAWFLFWLEDSPLDRWGYICIKPTHETMSVLVRFPLSSYLLLKTPRQKQDAILMKPSAAGFVRRTLTFSHMQKCLQLGSGESEGQQTNLANTQISLEFSLIKTFRWGPNVQSVVRDMFVHVAHALILPFNLQL